MAVQTTLRIDDNLYRDVKAKAAREGVTLTRFLEEGLRMRLEKPTAANSKIPNFRVHEPPEAQHVDWGAVLQVAEESSFDYDTNKIGIKRSEP